MNEDRRGYEEMTEGIFVDEENAFDYALDQCVKSIPEGLHKIEWTQEFREVLVEWFYSGNWIKVPLN